MKIELSKQLKDLGLGDGSFGKLDGKNIQIISGLSLPELIDACGEKFGKIEKKKSILIGWHWVAHKKRYLSIPTIGDTPEEAVAKLYIALNKK